MYIKIKKFWKGVRTLRGHILKFIHNSVLKILLLFRVQASELELKLVFLNILPS